MDDNNGFNRAMVAAFVAFVLIVGSLLWNAWAAENPIVIGDGLISHLLADAGESSQPQGTSAFG